MIRKIWVLSGRSNVFSCEILNLPTFPAETDEEKKAHYKNKILEYMQRAEDMKASLKQVSTKGEILDKIHIIDGATGYSYKRVFEKYCGPEVREALIEEPYLKDFYQVYQSCLSLVFEYFSKFFLL
jgi:hypothetical protein